MKKLIILLFCALTQIAISMEKDLQQILIGDLNYDDLVYQYGQAAVEKLCELHLIPTTGKIAVAKNAYICRASSLDDVDSPTSFYTMADIMQKIFGIEITGDTVLVEVLYHSKESSDWRHDTKRNFLKSPRKNLYGQVPAYLPFELLSELIDNNELTLPLFNQPCTFTIEQSKYKTISPKESIVTCIFVTPENERAETTSPQILRKSLNYSAQEALNTLKEKYAIEFGEEIQ